MRLSERALKDQLYDIAENDFELPTQADPLQRAREMLPHLGSPDAELRDDLIYTALDHWITRGKLTDEQLHLLLTDLLGEEQLFFGLGEQGTDSVFRRSFSVLLLPLILYRHRQRPFLTETDLRQVKSKLLEYLEREQDLRGFVIGDEEDKGWAYAVAHTADALDELAQCPALNENDLKDILQGIQAKTAVDHVYIYGEDERLVTPVIAVLGRKLLKESDVTDWLAGFVPLAQKEEPFPACYFQAHNVKTFLRSLYFRAQKPETAAAIGDASAQALGNLVDKTLQEISRF